MNDFELTVPDLYYYDLNRQMSQVFIFVPNSFKDFHKSPAQLKYSFKQVTNMADWHQKNQ